MGFQRHSLFLLVFCWAYSSAQAIERPPNFFASDFEPFAESSAAVDFTSILMSSNCSGAIVRFPSSLGTDHAMALTNGHCVSNLRENQVLVNHPVTPTRFNLLKRDGTGVATSFTSDRVLYATTRFTDVGLYELHEIFDEIEKGSGMKALTLSNKRPTEGRPIALVSGYWKKIETCAIQKLIFTLQEEPYTWKDSIRYSPGCNSRPGASGSPIIDLELGEIVGVNNTHSEDGIPCSDDRPCEIDESGNIEMPLGKSYAQQTYWLTTCLNSKNGIDLSVPGCLLPRP